MRNIGRQTVSTWRIYRIDMMGHVIDVNRANAGREAYIHTNIGHQQKQLVWCQYSSL